MANGAQLNALFELHEIVSFVRSQGIPLEERDDDLSKVTSHADDVVPLMILVIVGPPVYIDRPHSEKVSEVMKRVQAPSALNHHKRMTDLPPGSISDSIAPAGLTSQADRKTTFAINESDDPSNRDQSFLLIVRTSRFVTQRTN